MITLTRAGILTASDRSFHGRRRDESGILLKTLAESLPAEVVAYQVFPDEKEILKRALCHMADVLRCDLILTTGGTGLSSRDQTPEATREVIDREIPGIAEAVRAASMPKTPFAMLSRAASGLRAKTLIVNLPGSPKAVREAFEILRPVLPHALEVMKGGTLDCHRSSSLPVSHSS